MKKYYLVPAVAMLLAVMTTPAYSAQNAGDKSLQLGGGFFHSQGTDAGTLTADVAYGYYATKNVELGIAQTLGYSFIDGADDEWTASTAPFVNYHFLGLSDNDVFQPFIGAFIGAVYNDNDVVGTVGPQVGFKSYVNDSTFIAVKYRFEWFWDDMELRDGSSDDSDGNHIVSVGVGFNF